MSKPTQAPQEQQIMEREVYIGPRPFERSEQSLFFGRDREISELLSLVTSNRIVLCYAPSGAGKTSLINAGLGPRLEKEGFNVLPSTRVRGLIPGGIEKEKIVNLYMFSALLSLVGKAGTPNELMDRTLKEHLAKLPHILDDEGFPAPRILIFDQFEELLTSYPERWRERDGFFLQVRDALEDDPLLRILFIMREDFIARIEPLVRLLKSFQNARFRLDLLGPNGARAAVFGPIHDTDRHFKDGVVDALIEELQKVRVETNQGPAIEVIGEYIEPVQLQVVCRNLWTSLPPDVQEISHEHLKAYGDVDHALRDFYESCLTEAKSGLGADETSIRKWFEHQLITPAGTRGIVFRDVEQTADLPNPIVDFLENRHLIRGEFRAGSRWYELTHDRFIDPIQRANEHWRVQRQAHRNRLLLLAAIPFVLALLLFIGFFNARTYSSQSAVASTAVAATINVVEANVQATSTAQAEQAQIAMEDVALSKSRQLAAQSLFVDDPSLAILLAVQANRFSDTMESRKSLHNILSENASIDGTFLQALYSQVTSPSLVKRLENKSYIQSVAVSPDGTRFISASQDGTLIIWDFASMTPIGDPLAAPKSTIMSVEFSPDGKYIAGGTAGQQVLLWDASSGQIIGNSISDHGDLVPCVEFSPDGNRLVSGSVDKTIRIWDISKGKLQFERVVPQPGEVWSIAWSPDGKTLAVAGAGAFIRLLDTETFNNTGTLKGENGFVRALAWSPDGSLLVSGSAVKEGEPAFGEVAFWDPINKEMLNRLQFKNNQPVRTVAFQPDGKVVAIGQDNGTITFIDASSKQVIGIPTKAHNHRMLSIAFSPDRRYMLSSSVDKTIAIWDLFTPARSITINSKSNLLAVGEGSAISLWDLSGLQNNPLHILYGHLDEILSLTFNPDGSVLASAGRDGTIRFWDAITGNQLGQPIQSGIVKALDISPDGSTLATGDENGTILLWDIASHESGHGFNGKNGAVLDLSFGEDGKTLQSISADGTLYTWNLTSDQPTSSPILTTQGGQTNISAAFSQNRQQIALFERSGITTLSENQRAQGIEISRWDQSFDPTVNPDNIDFIVVKATEGRFKDDMFDEYLKSIQQIPVRGAMHFFRGDVPWKEQADFFLDTVKNNGFQFYILDIEPASEHGSTTFLSDVEQWFKYVDENSDQKILLQTSSSYMNSFSPASNWMKTTPLLIMYYPINPDPNSNPILPTGVENWKIWNYSEGRGKGNQYGVGGNDVFLDVYNGTLKDMVEWLEGTTFVIYNRLTGEFVNPNQAIQVTAPNDIAVNLDGSYAAFAGNGLVTLFDTATGEQLSALSLGGRRIVGLSFTLDSKLAAGLEDGTVLMWNLGLLNPDTKSEPMLLVACSILNRNLTADEWLLYVGDTPYQNTCPNLP